MKKLLLIMILILSQAIPVFSQDEPVSEPSGNKDGEIKTIFKKSDHHVKVGYYISPEAAWTQFDKRNVFLGGLSLGVIINHFFSVGLAGYGILNSSSLWYEFDGPLDAPEGAYLYGGYGGVKFEFRILPNSPVHINFPILIGGGGLVYNTWSYHNDNDNNNNNNNNNYYYQQDNNSTTLDWDSFFVVEPGVMAELNLVKFLRLDAGISYRYVPDLDLMQTKSNLVNNFNVNLSLKFGKF